MKTTSSIIAVAVASSLLFVSCGGKKQAQPTAKQPTMTLEQLQEGAKNNDKNALFELGAVYHDGQSGVTKDLAKAREYFEQAAKQGEVRAQFNLGVMYYTGEGVKQNYATAQSWFEKSAAQNNPRAQFNLGVMYYRGEGIKQDFKKARELFQSAALQGFNEARFNLGVMDAKAEGAEQDVGKAYAWFSLAKDGGNKNAEEAMKNIERALKPEEIEIVKKMAVALKEEVKKIQEKLQAQSATK